MKKNRIIKEIFIIVLFALAILLIFQYKKLNYDSKTFDYIEDGIVSIYREENEEALKNFEKAYRGNDEDIYEVINYLGDEDILNSFYSNKIGKSSGYAEYREATSLIFANKYEQSIDKLKEASDQGNIGATSFLATYLYSLKRYSEAYEYFEKAYAQNNFTIYPTYVDMKNHLEEFKHMEELYVKFNQNKIEDSERYTLGKFLLDRDDVSVAYKILKPFIEMENVDALFAKASFLEMEGEIENAIKIYRELYIKHKYAKSALKLAEYSDLSTKSKRKKAIEILDQVVEYNKDIQFMKSNLLYSNDEWSKAKQIYDSLELLEYIPVYSKLGEYYENSDETNKALEMYKKSFEKGNLNSILNYYSIVKNLEMTSGINPKMSSYIDNLKIASKLGVGAASYEISLLSDDVDTKKKYAIIALSQNELKALELLVDLANKNGDKEKIRVYTNILINNK
ncbi:tetratricopeptide repeat protein [Streptobacillus moniliformis]|uniref:tetratricopeptide repeat protein n=1 Tax=Streptobacillus moniliformis TaxID=34105 RepID=UPI0007E37F66|nr:tetratricopeptide repeat protein [Streptobacillus moniliformis]